MKIKMTQPPENRKTAEYPERFKAENGSYICNTLLGCDITVPDGLRYAREHHCFTEICPRLIRSAVRIPEEIEK